ncbi:hypothetical protein LCGC14_0691450 [marine sediment metagenome]|uniref:Terminase small subunit n=1 Tax=marine sediment metagenome TaxID=412755 RepID=A0A0F9R5P5_9ZZZZ
MAKDKPLTPREEVFCQCYCNLGSPEFSNGTKSAIRAEYKKPSAHNRASQLLKTVRIQNRIQEIYKQLLGEIGLTEEKVIAGILHDQEMARAVGDWKASNACSKQLGETLALFKQRQIVDSGKGTQQTAADQTPLEREAGRAAAEAFKRIMARGDSKTHESNAAIKLMRAGD